MAKQEPVEYYRKSSVNNAAESPTVNNAAESLTVNNAAESPIVNNAAESLIVNNAASRQLYLPPISSRYSVHVKSRDIRQRNRRSFTYLGTPWLGTVPAPTHLVSLTPTGQMANAPKFQDKSCSYRPDSVESNFHSQFSHLIHTLVLSRGCAQRSISLSSASHRPRPSVTMADSPAPAPTPTRDGPKIINASLFRMGTKSMALAYQALGYKTHHGLLEDVMETPWSLIERAAEATWPDVPGATQGQRPPPHTRADWDAIWGSYDAVTDIASPFVPELIRAYPDAKVVVVQRDFDGWWPSFRAELRDKVMGEPLSSIQAFITSRILGIRPVHAMKKVILGFCDAKDKEGVNTASARKAYDAYFDEIRRIVPLERRLEYKIGSGWEPLCSFLGVDVPDVPFPWANEQSAHAAETKGRHIKFIVNAAKVMGPWVVGAAAISAAWLYVNRQ
ncbi:hypothetical protein ACRALDRAFT_2018314 [Sodiomyces alcalophilus JCM 7366]|uniref:uncharacterized protein n=1 Tax=Sodiomyces alcalophilus JCM 7366 TaxID=591952 RepID=UPI0039B63FF2